MQSINLIPEQEIQEQTKVKAVQVSTWFTIVILIIAIAVSAYFLYSTRQLDSQVKALNTEIEDYRASIRNLAEVEVNARNLDKKYLTLKDIFAQTTLYSLLVKELEDRTPEGVIVDAFTVQRGGGINLSGRADNYISVAAFTNNLADSDYSAGNAKLKGLFKTVVLNSVSLEKTRNQVRYSINLEIDADLLKDK